MIDHDQPDELWSAFLNPAEILLWQGRPRTGWRYRTSSMQMSVASVFLLVLCLGSGWYATHEHGMLPWPLLLTMGGFVVFATLFLALGGWMSDAHSRARTRYAISDQRIFILKQTMNGPVHIYNLPVTPRLVLNSDTSGAIYFALQETFFDGINYEQDFGFEQLEDPQGVFDLLTKASDDAAIISKDSL